MFIESIFNITLENSNIQKNIAEISGGGIKIDILNNMGIIDCEIKQNLAI